MIDNVKITKDGRLIGDRWDGDKREYDRDQDLTDQFLLYFDNHCELGDGVTLRSLCLLIKNLDMYPILSPLFTHGPEWLKEFVDEGLNGTLEEKSVDHIVLRCGATISDDYYNEGETIFEGYVDMHGLVDGEDETYALDFTPINKLVDCDIRLDRKLDITDEREESRNKSQEGPICPTLFQTNKNFSLRNILLGIFWELSFHGGPKSRDEKREEIMETMRRIDSGEEKTIPWEDIKKEFELDDETNT